MGALHPGHLSLIARAKAENEVVIASIFVNPTQFNNPEDLKLYPRMEGADTDLLESAGCDVVFIPSVQEMYPTPQKGHWDFQRLTTSFEGHFRPGHFDGVCTVVKKLFEMVNPDAAYFGQKDFQQLAVIRRLVEFEQMPVRIVPCETMREPDGLAMSSRNLRLTPEARDQSLVISRILLSLPQRKLTTSVAALEEEVRSVLASSPGIELEYFSIVNAYTFEALMEWPAPSGAVALVACYCGGVRLIDNVVI
jgi:pantoate--beta-alanine ligase